MHLVYSFIPLVPQICHCWTPLLYTIWHSHADAKRGTPCICWSVSKWIPRSLVAGMTLTSKHIFSETAGSVRPERALFTIGTPRDCLGICPVDSSGAPLWTPSLEWRSLWIQSSMEVVRGIRSFCQCLSPSVALFTVVVTIWQLPLSIMCICTKFPFLQQSGEGFSSSNPPLLALWEGWGIAEFE